MIQSPVQSCGKALVPQRRGLSRTPHGRANWPERQAYDGSFGLPVRSIFCELIGTLLLVSRRGFLAHPFSFIEFFLFGIVDEARLQEVVTGTVLYYILYSNQKKDYNI
jgi:hypothetical protein